MKDIRDIEEMIYILHNKLRHLTSWTYKWQGENESKFREIDARLEALEKQHHPGLADPDPCADGFCPVELFRPIDETEGSN